MVSQTKSFDSGHTDVVHDVQFDYYGKLLATCSSDKTIKVFSVGSNETRATATLVGHNGPIWQVQWAHPKFGSVIASASYDRRVIVWKMKDGSWSQVYATPERCHASSINSVAFGPPDMGLVFAAASSDGVISIHELKPDGSWEVKRIPDAHPVGALSVSWAPAMAPGSISGAEDTFKPLLASGGCDKTVKIWSYNSTTGEWENTQQALQHSDWVRDVAWAPSIGLPKETIAVASQSGEVAAWSRENRQGQWKKVVVNEFEVPVWRVSWSVTGNILAVSDSKNEVTLWRESIDHQWEKLQNN